MKNWNEWKIKMEKQNKMDLIIIYIYIKSYYKVNK